MDQIAAWRNMPRGWVWGKGDCGLKTKNSDKSDNSSEFR